MLPRAAIVALVLVLAGCVAPGSRLDAAAAGEGMPISVLDATTKEPIAYATWTLFRDALRVAAGDVGPTGRAIVPAVGDAMLRVEAAGYLAGGAMSAGGSDPHVFELARVDAADVATTEDLQPGLRLLTPHLFDGYVLGPEEACAYRNTCGLSEPVLENAPDDVVYASATCCVGGSPPVWVSRDAGVTWDTLDTPGVREAVGIEGDFAVDAAGNVYFTDILVGAMWLTSWDAEGNWRHTVPAPFEPLVDRPWVRAGAEDVVYFLYNTAADGTNFHVSTDGGLTFSPAPVKKFPAPLGTIAQGPELDHLWVVAGMMLYESTDGGQTWSEGEEVPLPEDAPDDAGSAGFAVPAVDPAGRVMVAYDLGTEETGFAIVASVREPDGAWNVRRLTENGAQRGCAASASSAFACGTHVMPWPEAGPDGGFVVGWYGTDDDATLPDAVAEDAKWYAFLAASWDAGATWQRSRADPDPVLEGPMLRRLLDFLQVDLDERGAAHLVYSHNREGGNDELTSYVRTTVGLGLPQLPFRGQPEVEAQPAVGTALPGYPRHLSTE